MNPAFLWLSIPLFTYILLSVIISIIFSKLPRRPRPETPDWGTIEEVQIPTVNDKYLEAWIVRPDQPNSDLAVVLTHGWARNRGRMVERARMLGNSGYITILFSVRDHGSSDKEMLGMNIYRFSEDIKSVVNWWNKPVVLLGHSIGAGASILAARDLLQVMGIIADAPPYAIPESLNHIYRPVLKNLTPLFMPAMRLIVRLIFIRLPGPAFSPKLAAKQLSVPTLVIHGKEDELLPFQDSIRLVEELQNGELLLLDECDHHNLEAHPTYRKRVIEFVQSIDG